MIQPYAPFLKNRNAPATAMIAAIPTAAAINNIVSPPLPPPAFSSKTADRIRGDVMPGKALPQILSLDDPMCPVQRLKCRFCLVSFSLNFIWDAFDTRLRYTHERI